MWDPIPHRRHKGRRSEELKTEHLLGIEAPSGEMSAPPFRFMSLPAEIRNRVYSWHFADTQEHPYYNLAKFKDPPITLVSKQIRREAQPIFFGECAFKLFVTTNIFERTRKSEGGHLILTPRVHRCLTTAGDAAMFRHLRIEVVRLERGIGCLHKFLEYLRFGDRIATIVIQTRPKLKSVCTFEARYNHPRTIRTEAIVRSDTTLRDARIVAEKLSARHEFNGFSLDDLTQIAQVFCVAV